MGRKFGITGGEEDWCDYFEVEERFSVEMGHDLKFNTIRPREGAKILKSMKKVRKINLRFKE